MAFIIVHSVLKKRSQLYSQVHGCSKHHVNFTLNTSKQLKPLRACGMYVPTSKKINFSSGKHTWLARTTAEMQPCHVTGVPSTVRSFPGFMVLQFLIFFKVSLEIHQCDGNWCRIHHSLVFKTQWQFMKTGKNQLSCVSVLSNAVTVYWRTFRIWAGLINTCSLWCNSVELKLRL